MNPFAAIAAHAKLCPKCMAAAREIFRVQDAVKARQYPYATGDDYNRVNQLTGDLCAEGARMWEEGRAALARTILQG